MTSLKLPISASQAVVGAILGVAAMFGKLDTAPLGKIIICWIFTPIGGCLIAIVLYFIFLKLLKKASPGLLGADQILRASLIVAGCWGAYALGANNAANVTGVFTGTGKGMLPVEYSVWLAGASIALGVLTYSRKVMMTVGESIVRLDAYSAFIAVLAHAITVWLYAIIGVPVSSTQAVIGALFGIGLIKGMQTIRFKMLGVIALGWLFTPAVSFALSALFVFLSRLEYIPG